MSRLSIQTLLFASVGVFAVACIADKMPDTGGASIEDGGSGSIDADGDGFTSDEDCNDDDASIHPGAAEECDGVDNNCDDEIDEGVGGTYYSDSDGDGFGDATLSDELCEALAGWVPNADDCDDTDSSVYPGATEICDGMDNDCDSDIDEELDGAVWYADNDADGLGDPADTAVACDRPAGYVNNDWDCDDGDDGEPVFVSGSGTVEVPGVGADSGDTWGAPGSGAAGSVTNPYESIQDGISASDVCVYVTADRYGEDIDFGGQNILVWGIDGAAGTIIEGTGRGPVVTFNTGETAGATLSGFTITGGAGNRTTDTSTSDCGCATTCTTTTYTYAGGGIYIDGASPTLEDLIVEDNQLAPYSYTRVSDYEDSYVQSYGGGIYVAGGRPTLSSSIVRNNFADSGGGLYADSASSVTSSQSVFDENSASSGGGIGSEGTIASTNVVFVNNSASGDGLSIGGAGVDVAGGIATLTNVTGAGNDGQGSVYIAATASATIMNSIIAENADADILDGETGAVLDITYSDVYNSANSGYSSVFGDRTGSPYNNIDSDPVFTSWSDDDNYGNDDLSLRPTSPGVDAGNPNPTYYDADGSINDMGAWGGPNGSW
jgi:Putative metal-binding motif